MVRASSAEPESLHRRRWWPLPVGAPSREELSALVDRLATELNVSTADECSGSAGAHQRLEDIADHLQSVRCNEPWRTFALGHSEASAAAALRRASLAPALVGDAAERPREVVLLLPGLGDQRVGVASDLYGREPVFRETVDACAALVHSHIGADVRDYLAPTRGKTPTHAVDDQSSVSYGPGLTSRCDPAPGDPTVLHTSLFIYQYALVALLDSWGVKAGTVVGYSLGEYVAACVAGIMRLADALWLVAERARLIARTARGRMLIVAAGEDDVARYLPDGVRLAVVNGDSSIVLSGPLDEMTELERTLATNGIVSIAIRTSHALHSHMMESIAPAFEAKLRSIPLCRPKLRYMSCVTGSWETEGVTHVGYWLRHLCSTVRFADSLTKVLASGRLPLLEIGPGQALTSFVKQHRACTREDLKRVMSCSHSNSTERDDYASLLEVVGRLWLLGVPVKWPNVSSSGAVRAPTSR